MVSKISLYVTLLPVPDRFHFVVPETMKVAKAKKLVCNILKKQGYTVDSPSDYKMIRSLSGKLVKEEKDFLTVGITNEEELILIRIGREDGRDTNQSESCNGTSR